MKFGLPTAMILLPIALAVLFAVLKPKLDGEFEINHQAVEWDKGKIVTLLIFALHGVLLGL